MDDTFNENVRRVCAPRASVTIKSNEEGPAAVGTPASTVEPGGTYSNAYLEFLRALITLRTLNISEETLRDLWHLEKKLLQLIHVDSTGSPTCFLDSCGAITRQIKQAGEHLGIALLDHIIFNRTAYFSFLESGKL